MGNSTGGAGHVRNALAVVSAREGALVAKYVLAIAILLVALVTVLSGCNDTGELPQPGGVIVGRWYAQRATGESVAAGVPGPVLPMMEAMSVFGGSELLAETFRFENASNMHYKETLGNELLFWWDAEYQVTSRQPSRARPPRKGSSC